MLSPSVLEAAVRIVLDPIRRLGHTGVLATPLWHSA